MMQNGPEYVILVDEQDRELGSEEKISAHKKGLLHRAFSIFVFNSTGQLLLQKRTSSKYHSGGLWSNTCCSHPRQSEGILEAGHRRLREEMGFDCDLEKKFSFIYQTNFGNGLREHELDHVLVGAFDGNPNPDPQEVSEWKWMGLAELKSAIATDPEKYTYWLQIALEKWRRKQRAY